MAWNPDVYNQFKEERYAPFYDLLSLVNRKPGLQVIDLGCGTGELTAKLAAVLPGSEILGIDSSQEMLDKAKEFSNDHLRFICRPVEGQIAEGKKWDLIFSNAALQWVGQHDILFPALIALLNKGGQLTVQMPSNNDHPAYRYLYELASQSPYQEALNRWTRETPVIGIADYAKLIFDRGGSEITVFEKVYAHVLKDWEGLFGWVSGTALIPYMEKLPDSLRQPFKNDYRQWLAENFPGSPVFYPFKRILMSARFI